jgi:hypothetical protein
MWARWRETYPSQASDMKVAGRRNANVNSGELILDPISWFQECSFNYYYYGLPLPLPLPSIDAEAERGRK